MRPIFAPDTTNLQPLAMTHQLDLLRPLFADMKTIRFCTHREIACCYTNTREPEMLYIEVHYKAMGNPRVEWYRLRYPLIDDAAYGVSHDEMLPKRQLYAAIYETNQIKAPTIRLHLDETHTCFGCLKDHALAMITAYNPQNALQNHEHNVSNNERLEQRIIALGYSAIGCIGGVGEHQEPGFLIADITFDKALELGREFGQYSIFYATKETMGYYESAYGYPVYFTTIEHRRILNQEQREEAQYRAQEREAKRAKALYEEQVHHQPIDISRELAYFTCKREIEELFERISDQGMGVLEIMARQHVPREQVVEAAKRMGEDFKSRLHAQGFDAVTEKMIALLLRRHGIQPYKAHAKAVVALYRTYREDNEQLNQKLFEKLQEVLGAFDGTSVPKTAEAIVYVLQLASKWFSEAWKIGVKK